MRWPEHMYCLEEKGKRCVNGAALGAIGWDGLYVFKALRMFEVAWPWAYNSENVACPECGDLIDDGVMRVNSHLNDLHLWSKTRIADWVESIERESGLIPDCESSLIDQTNGMLDVLQTLGGK